MSALSSDVRSVQFYAALRQIEAAHPMLPPLGCAREPQQEPVRLGQSSSLAFAAGQLCAWQDGENGSPARLQLSSPGVLGINGALPLHVTEFIYQRLHLQQDASAEQFIGVLQHRLLCLLYRVWASAQPVIAAPATAVAGLDFYLARIVGWRTTPSSEQLYYSAWLAQVSRPAEGLLSLLRDVLGLPLRLLPLQGRWLRLAPADRTCLGGGDQAEAWLGRNTLLGTRLWSVQQGFVLQCGPLNFDAYRQLLPGGDTWRVLRHWVQAYVGHSMCWRLQLLLSADQVPAMYLGRQRQLGRDSWLAGAGGQVVTVTFSSP